MTKLENIAIIERQIVSLETANAIIFALEQHIEKIAEKYDDDTMQSKLLLNAVKRLLKD